MIEKLVKFIFFGNYFVGFLAVALSVETAVQLQLPLNSAAYYLLLFCVTVGYYTYAYTGILHSTLQANLRSIWYEKNMPLMILSQRVLALISVILGFVTLLSYYPNILLLPLSYWLVVAGIACASLLYYGLLPRSILKLNLRNTGWIKAFVIGLVWAGCVSILPIIMLRIEGKHYHIDKVIAIGLFIKNWMFCTVNAIIFDIKDYADDSNKQLKTFVVTFGLRRTISFVLIPLILIGIFAMLGFTSYRHFGLVPIGINLIPFVLLLAVAYSMNREKSIFYYLIVIDGLVLIKAICGILAMQFVTSP